MSEDYYIPFEIQSEIIKKLPVKSLLQFRSVSKQWKSFIDCPEFIKNYHMNHPNPQQHHLLVQYKLDSVETYTYTSIVDDNTFPQQKFPLIAPEPLNLLKRASILGSTDGLVCFCGYLDINLETKMAVIWNTSLRKCVGIPIPNLLYLPDGFTRIGFGVCRDTNDPTLVKINVIKTPRRCWEVQVFTLSSRAWKTVYTGAPFKSCHFMWNCVFIDGFIYWSTSDDFILSFDLKNNKFGEVCLPETLAIPPDLKVVKVNHSLGLLEYYYEGEMPVCGVWMRKDGVNKPFTKLYTVKLEGKSVSGISVLGFRNSGGVVLEILGNDHETSSVEVYEPSSGHISGVGIEGAYATVSGGSYIETLLLLDQPNSIIH